MTKKKIINKKRKKIAESSFFQDGFDVNDSKQVFSLLQDLFNGSENIETDYPSWAIDLLKQYHLVSSDENGSLILTEEGAAEFKTSKDLQNFLIDREDTSDMEQRNDQEIQGNDWANRQYESKQMKKQQIKEDSNKHLLYDEEDPEELDGYDEDAIDGMDFDSEVSSAINSIDADDEIGIEDEVPEEEVAVDNSVNNMETSGISTSGVVSMDDLEAAVRKILGIASISTQPASGIPQIANLDQSKTSATPEPQDMLATDFNDSETLTGSDEDLNAAYGHQNEEVLDSEFDDAQEKIEVLKDKIENEPSYNDYLEGDATKDELDMFSFRSDDHSEAAQYLEDDDDFGRNADLAKGPSMYDEFEPLDDDSDVEVLEPNEPDTNLSLASMLDDDSVAPEIVGNETGNETVSQTVNCAGTPIQIVLTGVMLTMPEIQYVAEAVKKCGMSLKKIVSKEKKKLNFIVEKAKVGKSETQKYIINYVDVDIRRNKYPFTLKNKKFQTLEETLIACKFEDIKAQQEHKNAMKFLNEDISTRQITENHASDIFKQFEDKTDYISSWSVKSVGIVNLKDGLNETYRNITKHAAREKNTLVQTKEGQFYLLKGNLKERSKEGTKKQLIEGNKNHGTSKVVGVYENSLKGLGQIMYRTKRTTIPLLIWK